MELTQSTINKVHKSPKLLKWFKPGHTVDDLIELHIEGHIDLDIMLCNLIEG